MKSLSLALLALGAAAAPQKAPPKTAKPYEEIAPVIAPAAIVPQKPLMRSTATRHLARYGPFELPALKPVAPGAAMEHGHSDGGIMSGNSMKAMNMAALLRGDLIYGIADMLSGAMDPEGVQVSKTIKEGICKDCSILSSKIDAVFENGTRADLTSGVYLHHIIALNAGTETRVNSLLNPWLDFCSGGGVAASMGSKLLSNLNWMFGSRKPDVYAFGAVDEFRQYFTTPDGKLDSGFYRGKDDFIFTQAELINIRPEPIKVYLQFDVEFVPGKAARLASTSFASATDCDKGIGFMGKGAGDENGKNLNINTNGLILSARGHMHDGGESMTVILNDKEFCTSTAEYGTAYEAPKLESPPPTTSAAPPPAAGAPPASSAPPATNAPPPGGMADMGGMEAMHGHGAIPSAKNATVNDNGEKKATTISKMSDCLTTFPVKAGDKMRLRAHYDLNAHPLRESGGEAQMQMGLVAFTWVPF